MKQQHLHTATKDWTTPPPSTPVISLVSVCELQLPDSCQHVVPMCSSFHLQSNHDRHQSTSERRCGRSVDWPTDAMHDEKERDELAQMWTTSARKRRRKKEQGSDARHRQRRGCVAKQEE